MILESQDSEAHSWAFHRRTSAAVRTCPYLGFFRLEFHFSISVSPRIYNGLFSKAEISLATAALFKFRFPPCHQSNMCPQCSPVIPVELSTPKSLVQGTDHSLHAVLGMLQSYCWAIPRGSIMHCPLGHLALLIHRSRLSTPSNGNYWEKNLSSQGTKSYMEHMSREFTSPSSSNEHAWRKKESHGSPWWNLNPQMKR